MIENIKTHHPPSILPPTRPTSAPTNAPTSASIATHNNTSQSTSKPVQSVQYRYGLDCYSWDFKNNLEITLLPDVLLETEKLQNGSNIFFHDTNCLQGILKLTVR